MRKQQSVPSLHIPLKLLLVVVVPILASRQGEELSDWVWRLSTGKILPLPALTALAFASLAQGHNYMAMIITGEGWHCDFGQNLPAHPELTVGCKIAKGAAQTIHQHGAPSHSEEIPADQQEAEK